MKLENSINYYYTVLALRLLLERGLISEDEYGKICRYNAEISARGGSTSSHIGYGLPPRFLVVFG